MKWTYLAQIRPRHTDQNLQEWVSSLGWVGLTTNLSGVFLLVSQAYHQHVSSIFRFWEEVAWSQREATEMWVARVRVKHRTMGASIFSKGQE